MRGELQRTAVAGALVSMFVCCCASARAEEGDPSPAGRQVTVVSPDAQFMVESEVVGETMVGDNYTVDEVNGDWLWIASRGGYLKQSVVVPSEEAIAHFTQKIRQEPSSYNYTVRGMCWFERGEKDIAIGDYSDAIRLDPGNDIAYNNRGNAWSDKGEVDNAIRDYSEAIRLDPQFAGTYNNRGKAWTDKGELDKAINDYSEAIRLNPQYAL